MLTQKPVFSAAPDNSFPTAPGSKKTARQAPVAPGRRLRGSCDFCTKRKRKCDGDGVNRCSFCIAKNQPDCHYSVRLLTGPRADSASRRASKGLSGKPTKTTATATAATTAAGGWDGSSGGGGGAGGRVVERSYPPVLPLKRARLSPSPATGLIGLRENVYIGEFFRTMGFLPFTSESFIRKAMVNTMFRAVQERDPGFHGFSASAGFGGGESEGGWGEGAIVPTTGAGPGDAIESAAGSCVLWCTVAVGCLVGGTPKSSVEGYAHLAREALSGCFDDGSVQTARAFTAMALLQNFMGNEEKFNKYIDFAKSIMNALPPEDVPVDLTDTHTFVKACDLLDGFHHRLGEEDLREAMGAVSGDDGAVSLSKQEPKLIQQADLCRWLLKTDIRMAACFSMDMQNEGFFEQLPASGCGPRSSSESSGDGGAGRSSDSAPHWVYDESMGPDSPAARIVMLRQMSDSVAEPPPPGPMSQKFAADILPDMNIMMHATNSPDVRGGVGELYFRSIMAYVCCLQGQQTRSMDGLVRCTDIFIQNPGICRFTAWKHLAHCCVACMYISGNCQKYEELRRSYNSVVDDDGVDTRKVPPIEEYRGMDSICSNVFCKSMFNFFMNIVAARKEDLDRASISTCTSTTPENEGQAKLVSPKAESPDADIDIDVDMTAQSPTSSDESWARGVFHKHRQQPAGVGGGGIVTTSPPAGPAAATPAPAAASAELGEASGFAGAFSSSVGNEKEQRPRGAGAGPGFGVRVMSPGSAGAFAATVSMTSSVSSSVSNNNSSVGDVEAGAGAAGCGGVAATAAAAVPPSPLPPPSAAADQDVNRSSDQRRAGDGVAPLPLLSSAPSAQTSTIISPPVPAAAGDNNSGAGVGGLELLDASELEAVEGAGLLDAVDALLGEAVLEGFGEGGGEDDLLPFFEEDV